MNYPKPLMKRLVLTFFVGTGFFLFGIAFYIGQHDRTFFFLSLFLFIISIMKSIFLFSMMKRGTYHILEGICTDIRPTLLHRSRYLTIIGSDEKEYRLLLMGNCKICAGSSYRLYFKSEISIQQTAPRLLIKAMSSDNFLGMERIQ